MSKREDQQPSMLLRLKQNDRTHATREPDQGTVGFSALVQKQSLKLVKQASVA